MPMVETVTDVSNPLLSRRELTCNFAGLGGRLKKLDAVGMITKEFKLAGKVVIPIRLKTQMGRTTITGTFYIYDDENLAKKHVNPIIFARLEKAKAKMAEEAKQAADDSQDKTEAQAASSDSEDEKTVKPQ